MRHGFVVTVEPSPLLDQEQQAKLIQSMSVLAIFTTLPFGDTVQQVDDRLQA